MCFCFLWRVLRRKYRVLHVPQMLLITMPRRGSICLCLGGKTWVCCARYQFARNGWIATTACWHGTQKVLIHVRTVITFSLHPGRALIIAGASHVLANGAFFCFQRQGGPLHRRNAHCARRGVHAPLVEARGQAQENLRHFLAQARRKVC